MKYNNLIIKICLSIMMCLTITKVYAMDQQENTNIKIKSHILYNAETSTKGQLPQINNEEESECEHIEKAIIIDIDSKNKRLTVLPKREFHRGAINMILNIDKQTKIVHGKLNKEIPLKMLTKGMCVEIKYNGHLNSSNYQPITPKEIIILEDISTQRENNPVIDKARIRGICLEEGYLVIDYIEKDEAKEGAKIIVYIDSNTNVKSESGGIYTIRALQVGQRIKIYTNGILTKSIPQQTLGLEIIILK